MRRPRNSIGVTLFVGLVGSIGVVFFAFSYFNARQSTEAWEQSFQEHAAQTTAVIERVLGQGMLLRNKEAVHAALRDVSTAPGIVRIRILGKHGTVRFSTDPPEIGSAMGRGTELCASCHGTSFTKAKVESITRVLRPETGGHPIMAQARLIKNAAQCAGTSCHAQPDEKPYLGIMDLHTSMAVVEQANQGAKRTTLYGAIVMAIVGALATFLFIWRFVRQPLVRLVEGTRKVAAGDLGTRVELGTSTEFYELARAFNRMTEELAMARERSQKWEETLADAVASKTTQLKAAQRRISVMERMASLGKLAASVAHELNNPLAGILIYARLLQRSLGSGAPTEEQRADALRHLEVVRSESARCGDIVKNLLSFARQGKGAMGEHGLNAIVDRAFMTVNHLFKAGDVDVAVVPLAGDDKIVCDAAEIQQALIALLANAAEAMPNGGEVKVVSVAHGDDSVRVSVSDTGVGIPPEVMPDIFEPFVTTKGDEKGVGLGLSVVYGIVRRHEATIDVESEVHRGTTFHVTLPRRPTGNGRSESSSFPVPALRESQTHG